LKVKKKVRGEGKACASAGGKREMKKQHATGGRKRKGKQINIGKQSTGQKVRTETKRGGKSGLKF